MRSLHRSGWPIPRSRCARIWITAETGWSLLGVLTPDKVNNYAQVT